ncbi:MAG: CDP-glycerol glycerophosphotransferase family protein [Firmicutes bacterium]|nr:CDP-glycerol glycerophosphotransferase family protein [Bacillota bacterium]
MKKTILITAPIGRCVKNFLYTEMFSILKKKHKICLLSPLAELSNFVNEFNDDDVSIYYQPKLEKPWQYFLWSNFYEPIRCYQSLFRLANQFSQYKLDYYKAKNPRYFNITKMLTVGSSLIGGIHGLNKIMGISTFKNEYYKNIFKIIKPKLLISTAWTTLEDQITIYYAKKMKVPILMFPDSWDNFTLNGEIVFRPDKIAVWSDLMSTHAKDFHGFKDDDLVVTGIPLYDEYLFHTPTVLKNSFKERLNIHHDNKIITYTCNSGDVMPGEQKIIDAILSLIESGMFGKAVLVLRLNPSWNREKYKNIYQNNFLVRIDESPPSYSGTYCTKWNSGKEDNLNYVNIIQNSDVILTIVSMVVLEAALFDRPIVNIAFDPEMNNPSLSFLNAYNCVRYKPVINTGGVRLASNVEELGFLIKKYLDDPTLDNEGRKKIIKEYCGPIDGNSANRIVSLCEEMVG